MELAFSVVAPFYHTHASDKNKIDIKKDIKNKGIIKYNGTFKRTTIARNAAILLWEWWLEFSISSWLSNRVGKNI